jgi:hypothetical protein
MIYRYPSAPLAKSIIHPGGFNWVLIDGEHGLINDSNYYEVSHRQNWAEYMLNGLFSLSTLLPRLESAQSSESQSLRNG